MNLETGKAPGILSHFPPPYSPRPEQTKAILSVKKEFDAGKSIVALQGPTGIGKTFIGMTHARYLQNIGQKTHVLTVQKVLQSQYSADFPPPQIEVLKGRSNYRCGYGPTSDRDASRGYCRSSKKSSIIQECLRFGTPQEAVRFTLPPDAHACDYWAQLTRAMESPITLFNFHSFLFQQRLGRFGKRDFMILDECFVPETMVSTPDGPRRIDSVRPGDVVYNATGIGAVESVSTRTSELLFTVEFNDGSKFTATGNHPLFTDNGWEKVQNLVPGRLAFSEKGLRLLRERISTSQKAPSESHLGGKSGGGVIPELAKTDFLFKVLLEESEEPFLEPVDPEEDILHVKKNTSSAAGQGWQRETPADSSDESFHGPRGRLENGVSGCDKDAAWEWLSDQLQTGHSEPCTEDWDRGRRLQSYAALKEGSGPEEGHASYFPRVVRISNYKPAGNRPVFNLQISGHPSYFAEGKLVHNCHNAEAVLLQFVEISLSDKVLRQLGIRIDLTLKTPADVLAWIEKNLVVEKAVKTLGGAAFSEEVAEGLSPQETDRLKTLLDRVETLKKYFDMTEWVVDVTEEIDFDDPKEKIRTLRIRPVFVSLFARELIFSKAEKVLAMSATILDPRIWARNLGLSFDKLGYVEAPCTFPVKNRPIFLEYAGNMGWKTFDESLPKLYQGIVSIMNRHQGQRGIIHAHSEKLVRLITKNINTARFLYLDMFPNRDKTALLAEHLKRKDSIIVASAMHEGIDLKGDLSRFQMIVKTPWPSTGDPLVKKRMELDGSFLVYQAALKVTQSYGRSVRSDTDWASTYILDQNFERLLSAGAKLFPRWFTDAIQRSPKKL